MSRTDRTRPYWVKIIQDGLAIEIHDHRNGVCDIAGLTPNRDTIVWRGGRCHFDGDWNNPESNLWCGCPYCTGKLWPDRRHPQMIRREGRRQARDWWKEC